MSDALLRLTGVRKAFGGLTVIDGISMEVRRGGRTGLIGPNGSGKTTLFNLISGVYMLDAGSIAFDDRAIDGLASHQRIGRGIARSFQNIRLMPHLSAEENVMLGQHHRARGLGGRFAPLFGSARSRWVREARALLAEAGLEAYARRMVSELPYGVQKRIEIVRALVAQPQLLLLDEPAAGLNPAETAQLRELLESVSGKGITLLVVEHDMSFVRDLCDRVVVLNFGRKIAEGTLDEVKRDPQVLSAYLGQDEETADAA
jgi:branched-chain amino acid transport system ATP-binding protein